MFFGDEVALGPGKAELLVAVEETGSIRQAAMRMNISYMRAWSLIRTLNQCFEKPLVQRIRGGKAGGGARLTNAGRKALELYHQMEQKCLATVNHDWLALRRLLRK